ncbi:MAG: ADP-forming succinate--CoA ligase subunit beta [Dehalococcoidia bacterium]|tara:strand:- start:13953 stop:15113 length:1161 start_codon:yes stop_codon:yes gene_type:complete
MKLHEYQTKQIFRNYQLNVPNSVLITEPKELDHALATIGEKCVLKCQVHAGGRGKAGGVKLVSTLTEAKAYVSDMLMSNLVTHQTDDAGVPVTSILVEELTDIKTELYLAITLDRNNQCPTILASKAGGMEIEEVAESNPDDIIYENINPSVGLQPFQIRNLITKLEIPKDSSSEFSYLINALVKMFYDIDASLLEINPLVITNDLKVIALDGKVNIEDDAMFRHNDLLTLRDRSQEDQLEAEATDLGIAYVNLSGNVGCLVNGAGLAMATLDVTNQAGASPANFLDVGGGADIEKVAKAVSIILSDPKVTKVLVNIFGGILRCDIAADGIVSAYERTKSQLPLVVRMLGTNVDEGQQILKTSGLNVTFAETLSEAALAISTLQDN